MSACCFNSYSQPKITAGLQMNNKPSSTAHPIILTVSKWVAPTLSAYKKAAKANAKVPGNSTLSVKLTPITQIFRSNLLAKSPVLSLSPDLFYSMLECPLFSLQVSTFGKTSSLIHKLSHLLPALPLR